MRLLKSFLAPLILFFLTAVPTLAKSLESQAQDATGILWLHVLPGATTADGEPISERTATSCTFWNLEKVGGGYIAALAAHCVYYRPEVLPYIEFEASYGNPTLDSSTIETPFGSQSEYFFDAPKNLSPVKVLAYGDYKKENDVALIFVRTTEKHAVLPLADSSKIRQGDKVFSESVPSENPLDKALFTGIVSGIVSSEDPQVNQHIHVTIPGLGAGSSGSAVVDKRLGGVIGIVVIEANESSFVIVPSNTLAKFIEDQKHKP